MTIMKENLSKMMTSHLWQNRHFINPDEEEHVNYTLYLCGFEKIKVKIYDQLMTK